MLPATTSETLRAILSDARFLGIWGASALIGLCVLFRDLARHNRQLGSLMKVVWLLTVAYSGLLGLAAYYYAGRRQIRTDNLWRQGFRSVAHCYSGCGAGEILGVVVTIGLFSLGQYWTAAITFLLAYAFGVGLTMGPLVQDGEPTRIALKDAVVSESASIVVMEAVAITVDLWLSGTATLRHPLFWSSLVVSLSLGLIAAYPVNVLLLRHGVKEGMHNPRKAHVQ